MYLSPINVKKLYSKGGFMDFLNPYASIDVSLIDLIRNMGLGLILAFVWTLVVSKSTRLVVDTRQYLPVFLLLIPSMILIISIIKSSIALSLGLVGALSIVRFRTPIKEPEELLYLFVAIAVGLGLGANQVVATFVGFTTISLGLLIAGFANKTNRAVRNTFIDVVFPSGDNAVNIAEVKSALEKFDFVFEVKRVSTSGGHTEMLLDVDGFNMADFSTTEAALQKFHPKVEVVATQNARIIT